MQASAKDQPANAGKADQEAEAGRPTVVAAEAYPKSAHRL